VPSLQKFLSIDGWAILVGKNNRQNEYLLRHLSNGNDFWLHNQTRPGAHVLIKNHQGLPAPPPDTLNFAARLAGYYSRVKDNETAQIVYTLRKYVKKPKDSKAGKVIYSQEKSMAIVINYEQIKKDIKKMMVI
jgi:predicted ribosome quality control (RQC) complex YloA/Tae2 family protein